MAVATLVRNSLPAGYKTTNRLPQGAGLAGTRALSLRVGILAPRIRHKRCHD